MLDPRRQIFAIVCVTVAVSTIASVPTVAGQGSGAGWLAGHVVDPEDRPLSRAQITIVETGRSTLANGDGAFEMGDLRSGVYTVEATLMGYAPVHRSIEVRAGSRTEADFILHVTPLSLAGVQVTGTALGSDPRAVTQATTQVSGRMLERELSATVAQTLARQPGIRARYNGPAASVPIMRGLTGDRILVLQDGQRSSDLAGSAIDHTVTIDPLAAQRIEVVRGPATLLYGNNALGGVVNVISADIPTNVPAGVEGVAAMQGESAFPGAGGSVRVGVPVAERVGLTLRAGLKRSDDVRIGDDGDLGDRLANTDSRNWTASVGVGRIGSRSAVGGAVRAYGFVYGLPIPPGTEAVRVRGDRQEVQVKTRWDLDSRLLPSLRLAVSAQQYDHDELDPSDAVQMSFGLRTQTADVLLRQGALGPVAGGTWGFSGLFKQYENTGPAALTPGADSRGFGVFAVQEVTLLPGLATLQFGARYDHYGISSKTSAKFGPAVDRIFRSFSGSSSVRFAPSDVVSFSASVSRSFRAPTVEELFSGALHAGTGAVEYGTPTLAAERGIGVEALARVQNTRWSGQFVAYRNRISNYVHLVAEPDTVVGGEPIAVFRYAQKDATIEGVESRLEYAIRQDLAVGFTGDALRGMHLDGTRLSFMPAPRIGGSLRWDDGTFSFGADLLREMRQDRVGAADEAPTPAHVLLRIHSGLRIQRGATTHSLTLRVENLADEVYREATSRIKDFAPGPGRNVAAAYRVWF
ncbi:MAG: TonB-dependent receptor [Gemmatimonadota bacterium]